MHTPHTSRRQVLATALLLAATTRGHAQTPLQLLNVSYDPTREFYRAYNALFAEHWQKNGGVPMRVNTSHGGSARQARSVIDGLQADVVTLALAYDIDAIADQGMIAADWQKRLPENSAPYTSTVIFLTRKGNPKNIRTWDDLARPGVSVITPNPKTSGGARWNYLAAWAWALRKPGGNAETASEFMKKIFQNVPLLDTGARGATVTFAQRNIGDVLLAWENEAHLAQKELGPDKLEFIYPPLSILAEPCVSVVDRIVDQKNTRALAEAYLGHLYTQEAQTLIAEHFYRPRHADILAKYAQRFPAMEMVTIADMGGWREAQRTHFDDGGTFDRIYQPSR